MPGTNPDTFMAVLRGLAETAKSAEAVATAAAEQKQNPDDAAAVTISAPASIVSTAACEKQDNDNPGTAAIAASLVAGASAAAICS